MASTGRSCRCPSADAHATAEPDAPTLTRAPGDRTARTIRNAFIEAAGGRDAPAPLPYPIQRAVPGKMREVAGAAEAASRMQLLAGQGVILARAEPAGEVARRVWAKAKALLLA